MDWQELRRDHLQVLDWLELGQLGRTGRRLVLDWLEPDQRELGLQDQRGRQQVLDWQEPDQLDRTGRRLVQD